MNRILEAAARKFLRLTLFTEFSGYGFWNRVRSQQTNCEEAAPCAVTGEPLKSAFVASNLKHFVLR